MDFHEKRKKENTRTRHTFSSQLIFNPYSFHSFTNSQPCLILQRNLFPPENGSYQRLMELMQTRDPFYKPPQPSPVDETSASTKVGKTCLQS